MKKFVILQYALAVKQDNQVSRLLDIRKALRKKK